MGRWVAATRGTGRGARRDAGSGHRTGAPDKAQDGAPGSGGVWKTENEGKWRRGEERRKHAVSKFVYIHRLGRTYPSVVPPYIHR
jgi:hypothetical protein